MGKLAARATLAALLAVSAAASGETFGSWSTGTSSDNQYLYAGTVNDSGATLGQFCQLADGSCLWIIGMDTGCSAGDSYPVLANSDAGSRQLLIYCDGKSDTGLYRYIFQDFNAVDDIVRQGKRVGFAIPLQSDNFKAIRFALDGSVRALSVMRAGVERAASPAPQGTRDQFL